MLKMYFFIGGVINYNQNEWIESLFVSQLVLEPSKWINELVIGMDLIKSLGVMSGDS